jgi:hypothetical protein
MLASADLSASPAGNLTSVTITSMSRQSETSSAGMVPNATTVRIPILSKQRAAALANSASSSTNKTKTDPPTTAPKKSIATRISIPRYGVLKMTHARIIRRCYHCGTRAALPSADLSSVAVGGADIAGWSALCSNSASMAWHVYRDPNRVWKCLAQRLVEQPVDGSRRIRPSSLFSISIATPSVAERMITSE